jgi:hypothetical protein
VVVVIRLHLDIDSIQAWRPLFWVGGAAVLVSSATLVSRAPRGS